MAYCDWQDVQEKMQAITIKEDSKPSIVEVSRFADEVSQDMDSRLEAAGIILPIVAPGKLVVLKSIAVNGTKAEILRAVGRDPEGAEALQKLYNDAIRRIEINPSILNPEQKTGSGPGYSSGPCYPDRLTRGEKMW